MLSHFLWPSRFSAYFKASLLYLHHKFTIRSSLGKQITLFSVFLFIISLLALFYTKHRDLPTVRRKRDAPLLYQLTFQGPAIPSMEGVIDLHHEVMFYIIIIVFVLWLLIRIVMLFAGNGSLPYSRLTHHDKVEWA
jgi:hypothetical protein